jgi:hypothetical protein
MKKYLLSFCDSKYKKTLERLRRQAENLNVFDHIFCFDENYFEKDFTSKHQDFIAQNKRGYGYYIWKPYLILNVLHQMEDNDILVFVDGGCSLNPNGLERLHKYFDIVNQSPYGILAFQIGAVEQEWTKMDLFYELGCEQNEEIKNSGQMISGIVIIRKCDHVVKIYEKAYELGVKNNYHFSDDSQSNHPNCPTFHAHRHDQSILSLILKLNGCEKLHDETYFKQFAYDAVMDGTNYPIWASRIKY